MEIKDRHKLVKIKSIHSPGIITFQQAVKESGRTRQFCDQTSLTFGVIDNLNIKVIVDDDIYKAFIKKCKSIDKNKQSKNK